MKILMLLEHEFPGDVRVDKEVKALVEGGHSVMVASSTFMNSTIKEVGKGYIIYRKKISPFIYKASVGALKFPYYFNFWRKFIAEITRTEEIDAIHVHDLPLAKVGLEFKKRLGVKLIIDLHENWPALLEISEHTKSLIGKMLSSNIQWRRYEKYATSNADAVITVVNEMQQRIEKLGVEYGRIFVVENTPYKKKNPLDRRIDANYLTLTYIGGITQARGLQIVVQALPMILSNYANIRLWIVGDGRYAPRLKKMVNDLGVDSSVTFWGQVPSTETIQILSKSDIAIVPHVKSEQSDNSSPNKLYEYMLAGIPVIASNCRSIERVINDTKCGIVYQHDSPKDFAEKVINLISQKELFNKMSLSSQDAIFLKYNWEESSKELLRLYRQLIT